MNFARTFKVAAKKVCASKRVDLAWKLLHLFQLLQRDLMASAKALQSAESFWKVVHERKSIYKHLFEAIHRIITDVFAGHILEQMSTSVFVTWAKIARELKLLGDEQPAIHVKEYIEEPLKASILKIADALWRFQGHGLAGGADLRCDSCGVEAMAFMAALDTCQRDWCAPQNLVQVV